MVFFWSGVLIKLFTLLTHSLTPYGSRNLAWKGKREVRSKMRTLFLNEKFLWTLPMSYIFLLHDIFWFHKVLLGKLICPSCKFFNKFNGFLPPQTDPSTFQTLFLKQSYNCLLALLSFLLGTGYLSGHWRRIYLQKINAKGWNLKLLLKLKANSSVARFLLQSSLFSDNICSNIFALFNW